MIKTHETLRIRPKLPEELSALEELAFNLHWTWHHETIELFRRLDRDLWDATGHNPVRMLGSIPQDRLHLAARDHGFMDHLRRAYDHLQDHLHGPKWFEGKYGTWDSPKIAYFSMEFGLTECLRIYSGGLGILAGDHLKSASELGLPLAGVGLLYQEGYFQQYLNADGWQQETYPSNDFYNLPLRLETDATGAAIMVDVPFPGRTVRCRIWRAQVGRVPLYLLDTNTPENQERDRRITCQLYGGDEEMRVQQELVLGVGGMLALRKMDIHVHVCHMNEGHAAFMALERMNRRKQKDGLTTAESLEIVKAGTVFTTHTPVPAGIDEFHPGLVQKYLTPYLDRIGFPTQDFMALGRRNPDDQTEPFNMALLALRTTASANGVSELHGKVSRAMWHSIWQGVPLNEVPIGHITNGIHTRSWTSKEMADLLLRYLGHDWENKPADQSIWERVDTIPSVELWRVHERRRDRLVAFARRRLAKQLAQHGANATEIEKAREVLNPDALTIGFARRFASYKRATLLLKDPDRLKRLLLDSDRPVQFLFAGKAHPRDGEGKDLIRQLVHFARQQDVCRSIVFLENYDMNVARYLVQGVDVWMNTPRRPMEASGTSGMKTISNGGLNLSILDGWWCEGYDADTGWAIGAGEDYDDAAYQDDVESKALYDILENEIVPLFYERSADGPPHGWIAKMKASMKKLGAVFNTNRMVREYTDSFYMKAQENWERLSADAFAKTKALHEWKQFITGRWDSVRILEAGVKQRTAQVGDTFTLTARVHLGEIVPDDVIVQIYSGPLDADRNITQGQTALMRCATTSADGIATYTGSIACDDSGLHGYSVRVAPNHPDMADRFDLEKLHWIEEAARMSDGGDLPEIGKARAA